MRLILHNPHVETHIGRPVFNFLTKRFSHKKYFYLLDLIKSNYKDFAIYVDLIDTSLNFPIISNFRLVKTLELYFWLLINGINPFKIKILKLRKDNPFTYKQTISKTKALELSILRPNRKQILFC